MYIRMNHKIFENWFSGMAGIFGFGVFWTNVHWGEVLPKIFVATASAFAAGYVGYVGKLAGVWSVRKCKSIIQILKNRKYGRR